MPGVMSVHLWLYEENQEYSSQAFALPRDIVDVPRDSLHILVSKRIHFSWFLQLFLEGHLVVRTFCTLSTHSSEQVHVFSHGFSQLPMCAFKINKQSHPPTGPSV